jgi:hypothetical protein
MNATLKNASSKQEPFADVSRRTRQLRAAHATIVAYIFLYTWVGIVGCVGADEREQNRVVDMSSFTCAEFLQLPLPQALIAVGWIGGFYAGLRNDPNVNVPEFTDKADQIIALCREDQSIGVMALVERTFPLQAPTAK